MTSWTNVATSRRFICFRLSRLLTHIRVSEFSRLTECLTVCVFEHVCASPLQYYRIPSHGLLYTSTLILGSDIKLTAVPARILRCIFPGLGC
jgi:hypothetical protein